MRRFMLERNQAINEKVGPLKARYLILKVQYLDWLAIFIVVKNHNMKNRVC